MPLGKWAIDNWLFTNASFANIKAPVELYMFTCSASKSLVLMYKALLVGFGYRENVIFGKTSLIPTAFIILK